MSSRTGDLIRRLTDRPRGTAAFLAAALVVGVLVGAAAALLIVSVEGLQAAVEWLRGRADEGGRTLLGMDLGRLVPLLTVPAAFVMAWWIARRFAPEVAGDGVPEAAAALGIRAGYLPTRWAPLKVIVTAITLGGGGSAGREGPIVQIGATIGSSTARHTNFGEDQVRSLVAAGAGAAIGASFNAPIAGMLFALEVILGGFGTRHLNAVVVASVAAAVTSRTLVGKDQILQAFPHGLLDARELLLYVAVGVLAAAAAYLLLKSLDRAERTRLPGRMPRWSRPLLMGVGVAAIGVAAPRALGTGQEFVGELLQFGTEIDAWWVLIGLALAKILATSGTIGAGTSGGAFMPSLFIGATLGAGFAKLVDPIWTASTLSPGAFAVVGMAATFAAVARAPLTSIIIVFEITGDYGLVLPLMLAAALATFLADRIHPESVYTMPLARRGIRLVRSSEVDLLDSVKVGDVMSPLSVTATPTMSTADVQGLLDRHRHHGVPVVDDDGSLVGVITVTDIMRTGGPSDRVKVRNAMTPRPVTISPGTPVSVALERMAALGIGRIPVIGVEDPTKPVGVFRREDAVRAYHLALGKSTKHALDRERFRARTHPGASFFDFVIPAGSVADGRALREVGWPEGCTLVSVSRGRTVMVPNGSTELVAGDVLTLFATPDSHRKLVARLNASAGDPTDPDLVVFDRRPGTGPS